MEKGILKNFVKYVSLSILGMLGLSLYILVDTFFISMKMGSLGIAALNFSIPMYSLIHGLGLMIGIGGATRFSIVKAQKNVDKGNIVFSNCLCFGIFVGLVISAVGLIWSRPLAILLGADISTLSMTKTYLSTILSFAPFFILNNIMLAFIRNDNNPNLSMIAMLSGSFSNIILDYVFMYPLNMGMFGAAFATGLAPIISLLVLSIHFNKRLNSFKFVKLKLQVSVIVDTIRLGISTFISEISSGIVLITFNLVILRLEGNLGVTSYGIVANLALVGIAVFTGVAQGVQPLLSKSHGANEKAVLKRLLFVTAITSLILSVVIYVVSYIYTQNIVKVFNSENIHSVSLLAESGLRIYFIGFFFAGINIVVSTYLSATENTRNAFLISLLRGSVVFVPMVLIFGTLWHMTGVWLSFVITECTVMLIAILLLKKSIKI